MAQDEGSAQLQQAMWEYTGKSVLWLTLLISGFAVAWWWWSDLPTKEQLVECQQMTQKARSERENSVYEISRLQRENERLNRQLQEAQAAGAAAPSGAAPAAPA